MIIGYHWIRKIEICLLLGYLLYKHLNKKFYIEGLDSKTPPKTQCFSKNTQKYHIFHAFSIGSPTVNIMKILDLA